MVSSSSLSPIMRFGQRFVTLTSRRFALGFSALVTSVWNGAFHRMPRGWPLIDTSAISFTLPRSSITFVPGRNHAGAAGTSFV